MACASDFTGFAFTFGSGRMIPMLPLFADKRQPRRAAAPGTKSFAQSRQEHKSTAKKNS